MKKVFYIIITFVFVADRYFKDFSTLPKTFNPNFSFSLNLSLFITVSLIIILSFGFLILDFKEIFKENKYAVVFIALGGLSNLLDRFLYGGVVDYLNLFGIIKNNLADYLIFIGIILFLFHTNPDI